MLYELVLYWLFYVVVSLFLACLDKQTLTEREFHFCERSRSVVGNERYPCTKWCNNSRFHGVAIGTTKAASACNSRRDADGWKWATTIRLEVLWRRLTRDRRQRGRAGGRALAVPHVHLIARCLHRLPPTKGGTRRPWAHSPNFSPSWFSIAPIRPSRRRKFRILSWIVSERKRSAFRLKVHPCTRVGNLSEAITL